VTTTAAPTETPPEPTTSSGPGFGVLAASIALVASAFLAVRRD
jgi:PGF-CTERM protein